MIGGDFRWSASRLSTYLRQCTLKFFFRYIARIEPERTFSRMHFGIAVHAGLEAAYKVWKAGEPPPDGVAKEAFLEDLKIRLTNPILQFKEGETPEGLATEGLALIDVWAKEATYEEVLAIEQDFSVPIVHPKTGEVLERELNGRMDLVVRDAKTAETVIVDWKTTSRRFSEKQLEDDLQAIIYAYSVRTSEGRTEIPMRWDILVRNKKPVFQRISMRRGPERDGRLFELVRAAEHGVAAGVFFPNDGCIFCSGCPYTAACARWQDDSEAIRDVSADPK